METEGRRKSSGRIYPEACAVNFKEIHKRLRKGYNTFSKTSLPELFLLFLRL